MDERTDGRINAKYLIGFIILWVAQMAAAFYFCTQKQGFHEDEFYTYYSTARTNGFFVENGKWMDRETYRNEFVVLPGERFQYDLVRQVQSWDVHPPMYYWVFHTVASFFPGVFSKWIGLSVNLFFHGINLLLLAWLTYLVSKKDGKMVFLVNLVYGFCPAAMSGVVFIRMYEMLTTFVLLCAVLHMRVVLGDGGGRTANRLPTATLFAMAAVTYIGFLTQYYYFIFLFFLAAAFCLWLLWRDRKIGNCLRYGLAQGIAFCLAYLTYPAFPGQMFRGQRGAQATRNFFDLSNTFERLGFFFDLMNGYVFGYLFFVIALAVAMLSIRVYRQNGKKAAVAAKHEGAVAQSGRDDAKQDQRSEKVRFGAAFWILLFTAVGYFLAVSKSALLLGNTSNRYQLPIYGIIVLLALYSCKTLWRHAVFVSGSRRTVAEAAALAFCLAMVVSGYVRTDVVFLYPEAGEAVALAREQAAAKIPVVYVYQPGEEWCIWAVADEMMEYERVYFVSAENTEPLKEPAVMDADAVVIYLPCSDDGKEEAAQGMWLLSGNAKLSEGRLQYRHKYCSKWYYCGDETAADSGENP